MAIFIVYCDTAFFERNQNWSNGYYSAGRQNSSFQNKTVYSKNRPVLALHLNVQIVEISKGLVLELYLL